MCKQDFALNKQEGLICHKTQPTNLSVKVALSIFLATFITGILASFIGFIKKLKVI